MARGRFGRTRSKSSNLSLMIAQLMKEQRAAEDRAMFDAYQNGGLYKGKPVTDSRILGYIKGRRDGFAKDDPLYDEWNNRATQQEFRIGEEKIGLAFKQGKASAGAVAAFYRHQLAHLPKDSEFYREVAGRAADWAKSAGGAARGRAHSRLTSAFKGKQDAVATTWANYSAFTKVVVDALQREGVAIQSKADGTVDWTHVDATAIQDLFTHGAVVAGGRPLSYADWQNATNDAYKAFDTLIAVNTQLKRGTKTLTADRNRFFAGSVIALNTIDDRAKAEIANDNVAQAINDADNDPAAVLDAIGAYAKTLETILSAATAAKGAGANDPEVIGAIQNELDGATGGTPKGDGFAGLTTTTGQAVSIGEVRTRAKADADLIASGGGYYGQEHPGDPFHVVPFGPGTKYNAWGPFGGDKALQTAVMIDANGKRKEAVLVGTPVVLEGLMDPSGGPAVDIPDGHGSTVKVSAATRAQIADAIGRGYQRSEAGATTLGYVFENGGKTTYGVFGSNGELLFTDRNPFVGALHGATGDHWAITVEGVAQGRSVTPWRAPVPPVDFSVLSTATSTLFDSTVSPDDLRALAATKDDATAARLRAAADERQNHMRNVYGGRGPTVQQDIGNPDMGQLGMGNATADAVSQLGGVLRQVTAAANPPPIGTSNIGRPPQLPSMPSLSSIPPPVLPGHEAGPTLPAPPVFTPPAGGAGKAGASKPGLQPIPEPLPVPPNAGGTGGYHPQ